MRQYFGESTALLVVLLYRVRRDLIALCITMIVFRYLILSLFTSSSPLGAASRLGQALYAGVVLVLVTALWRETWVGKASALALSWGMKHSLHVSRCLLPGSLVCSLKTLHPIPSPTRSPPAPLPSPWPFPAPPLASATSSRTPNTSAARPAGRGPRQ